jgi:phage tail sheath protein FI
MADTYLHPGVYVKEISTLPPSVAEVSTAVPAFCGYTEKTDLKLTPTRIEAMLDYERLFGGPPEAVTGVTIKKWDPTTADLDMIVDASNTDIPLLYYSLRMYFDNGGGPCYIVSLGGYDDGAFDSPLYQSPPSHNVIPDDFKGGLAALTRVDEPTLIVMPDATRLDADDFVSACEYALNHCGEMKDRFAILDVKKEQDAATFRKLSSNHLSYGAAYTPYLKTSLLYAYDETKVTVNSKTIHSQKLEALKASDTALYNSIKAALAKQRVTLPPSGAIAGIYSSVDRDRGVWKAPANVAVASVIDLTQMFTDTEQDGLNVDPTSGKSINVIRSFTGRGILVWGARTLAGNDNEWRYIPVRRLFITIEESTKKATAFAVFEPNDSTTWLKVKAMIESYLYGLWERGALAGAKPEDAYFVNVGLGTTMTTQDILEGRMIVEIGIAAVRPAEFIILRFTHKLQVA